MTPTAPHHALLPAPSTPDAIHRLRPVLAEAGELDTEDHIGWARLRRTAQTILSELVAHGRLPAHLQLQPADPPAVVARTLAEAWQRATAAPHTRAYRY